MSLLEELLPASYKGASFLISSSSTNGGRKDQVHEFPNSDRQAIEDFGLLPRSYSIVGWITGDDYIAKRNTLLNALEDGEVGVLSHPFYGEIENIRARSFTISEGMNELGRAEISMQFDISNDIGLPLETENTLALINKSNDTAQDAANEEIANNWEVNTGFSGNFTAAQDKLGELNETYGSASGVVAQSTDEINEFNSQISNFGNNINSLISSPNDLAESIQETSAGMNALYTTAESQFIAWKGFFNFGENETIIVNGTAGITQRNKNDDAINNSMRSQALCYGYLAAAQIKYNTVNELDDIAGQLEEQYDKVIALEIDQVLIEAVMNMRENVNSFFNQSRINLSRIITINTAELPARVISFQYYNDSSIGGEIADLNNDANVSFMEGEIQVVTQ